jgi:hypothetical protein
MNLKFNPEAKVTEFREGGLYFKNEGDPVEVQPRIGQVLLRRMHEVQRGQFVPVFVVAGDQDRPRTKAAAHSLAIDYPEDFPHKDALVKGGFTFEAARVLSKDDLTKLDGIGPKSADAIIAAVKGE